MSSVTPDDSGKDVKPEVTEEPPPPPPEPEPEQPAPAPEKPEAEAWKEDYDELIGPEEQPKPRKRKKKHWGAIIVTIAIIVFLLLWTLFSPKVMTKEGVTYVNSPTYASWGNFTGTVDTWAGDITFGLSISGSYLTANHSSMQVDALLTKVYENSSSWFFRGCSVSLTNTSVFLEDGTWLASMSNHSNLGFGIMARVPVTFSANGEYTLYVHSEFTVYESMRIGFLPLKAVVIEKAYFDSPVVVG